MMALMIAPFACVIAIRLLAVWNACHPASGAEPLTTSALARPLPSYTALVPLHSEAEVIGQLIDSLSRINYPADQLEILLIIEADDEATRLALAGAQLAPNMRVVTVPPGHPRTKPRALNYALQEATGEYIVVFDAEDEPQPDQLRRAVEAFAGGGHSLGCLQARLQIYNAQQNWLTRQFALEYAALFACILPALQRFGLPIMLGGTSNHFPRATLLAVGGWDPYNVTEDADLGIRLARCGWRTEILDTATWEEAPATLASWIKQRARWLKGWMQTLIVHTRQPLKAAREAGFVPFLAFTVLMIGVVLSSLVHPWYYVLQAARCISPDLANEFIHDVLWWAGCANLLIGYAASAAVAVIGTRHVGYRQLAHNVVFIPVYWLLISSAAYFALYELLAAPYRWHKTPHVGRASART